MRVGLALLFGLAFAGGLLAADGAVKAGARYGLEPDLAAYPQDAPKAALNSVLKAADAGKFDYLTAQLADPSFIDARIKLLFGGSFQEQVKDTRARLDSVALKELRRFLSDGEWMIGDAEASARLKDVSDRAVALRKIDGRWFLEHASKPKS
jgi:hypothetical protein